MKLSLSGCSADTPLDEACGSSSHTIMVSKYKE